jgi:predicted HD phosphohydrolase
VHAVPTAQQIDQVKQTLGPELIRLFQAMQPSEQAHSLGIYHQLIDQGDSDNDLLAAALLHDAGKSLYPLSLWERVLIVLGKALLPNQAKEWGQSRPSGWRRPFVVAEEHARWGAELASQYGASQRTAWFIRCHQAGASPENNKEYKYTENDERLLERLRKLDNEN